MANMHNYRTMTVGGLFGSTYQGETADDAAVEAEKDGYEVLDIAEHGGEIILVVAD